MNKFLGFQLALLLSVGIIYFDGGSVIPQLYNKTDVIIESVDSKRVLNKKRREFDVYYVGVTIDGYTCNIEYGDSQNVNEPKVGDTISVLYRQQFKEGYRVVKMSAVAYFSEILLTLHVLLWLPFLWYKIGLKKEEKTL